MLGGELRVGRRISLVTENWMVPELEGAMISYGIRFFGESLSADLGLVNLSSEMVFPGIPYVDFVVSF